MLGDREPLPSHQSVVFSSRGLPGHDDDDGGGDGDEDDGDRALDSGQTPPSPPPRHTWGCGIS